MKIGLTETGSLPQLAQMELQALIKTLHRSLGLAQEKCWEISCTNMKERLTSVTGPSNCLPKKALKLLESGSSILSSSEMTLSTLKIRALTISSMRK